MNTAAAFKFDDTAPLQAATRLRFVTGSSYAENDETYNASINQTSKTKSSSTWTVQLNPNTCSPSLTLPRWERGQRSRAARLNPLRTLPATLWEICKQGAANALVLKSASVSSSWAMSTTGQNITYTFDVNDRLTKVACPARVKQTGMADES
jgi:hypothetical protein